jgi:transposase, IS5 family
MKGKNANQDQLYLFGPILKQIINPSEPLVLLADKIPWKDFDKEYEELYSNTGRPAKPIRLMVSLLILKQLNNLGDETIISAWIQNPYFQYFSGECNFQWKAPCDPSDLVHFRNRIGEDKINKILEVSINIQDDKVNKEDVIVDTTVQEKNITFPTDVKTRIKVIRKCNEIAENEGIILRQSYKRTSKNLLLLQRFSRNKKQQKKAAKAKSKLKTISNRLIRELERKLSEEKLSFYQPTLDIYRKAINQKLFDKNKIYSLHEPETSCIAKGKAHKKYEFGSKISLVVSKNKNVVLTVTTFKGNPNDGQTLSATFDQYKKVNGVSPKTAVVDRGYQGKKLVDGTQIFYPMKRNLTGYQKQKERNKFRRRAAIEPIISHVKNDFGMLRSYLKGHQGDVINSVLACAAFNFKRMLRKLEVKFYFCFSFLKQIFFVLKLKLSF